MKRYIILFLSLAAMISSCRKNEDNSGPILVQGDVDFRNEMRKFVIGLSQWSKSQKLDFIVIPQNGHQLCTKDGLPDGQLASEYLNAIDGQGREELFFGYDNNDDMATPADVSQSWLDFLSVIRDQNKRILVTDYCTDHFNVHQSSSLNEAANFVSFPANTRDLYAIPDYPLVVQGENDLEISYLSQIRNFLYLINTQNFASKADFIQAVRNTNYDAIIMDAFFEDESYTPAEIEQLRAKANGGKRLVIAYMSIGEAEDYRYYWQPYWSFNPPDWMDALNPDWPGNYAVQYWNPEWQDIIYGSNDSYLGKIMASGFDGTYLDIIDGFEYWEEK